MFTEYIIDMSFIFAALIGGVVAILFLFVRKGRS
ncbi:EYxxD motif small membrane protein [Metabacillus sp. RGM 3146]